MNYIDLGLPSGTLWAEQNEEGYFTFDEAKEKFRDSVPSIELWDELRTECKWKWNRRKKGYDVIGKNGNSIFLPADGYRVAAGLDDVGTDGYYWSSSPSTDNPDSAWNMCFDYLGYVDMCCDYHCFGNSIRLIKTN